MNLIFDAANRGPRHTLIDVVLDLEFLIFLSHYIHAFVQFSQGLVGLAGQRGIVVFLDSRVLRKSAGKRVCAFNNLPV